MHNPVEQNQVFNPPYPPWCFLPEKQHTDQCLGQLSTTTQTPNLFNDYKTYKH